MMRVEQINEMRDALCAKLLQMRRDGEMWRGGLSSSAISTAVAVFALHLADSAKYRDLIGRGAAWLRMTMLPDGAWGDTAESCPNMTATILAYAALHAVDVPPDEAKDYVKAHFGGLSDDHIIRGVMARYGKDLTFSAPILVMCAMSGVIHSWRNIPQLPFELSVLPQRLFRFLRLPVVSYAIPALIAVGILRHRRGKKGVLYRLRELFVARSLSILTRLQPAHGGFLEAAPLTAFVAICMAGAGYGHHPATRRAVQFLADTVRNDGAWPIDTDLASWVTALSVKAIGGGRIENGAALAQIIRNNAFKTPHPFTGAKEGGWGWTDLQGAVPDADDTAGSLVALHILLDGKCCAEVEKGVEWILDLQNSDGGVPTFCRGWGKLPFDRSSPDITAHALVAFALWHDALPEGLMRKADAGVKRMLRWMKRNQQPDGSWVPLWFGDQDAVDERSPVYGTAVAVEHLCALRNPDAAILAAKGAAWLASVQNADGGWGGAGGVSSKITFTAKAIGALSTFAAIYDESVERGFQYIYDAWRDGRMGQREPVGLYFARLWYSEELYNITFVLNALNRLAER